MALLGILGIKQIFEKIQKRMTTNEKEKILKALIFLYLGLDI